MLIFFASVDLFTFIDCWFSVFQFCFLGISYMSTVFTSFPPLPLSSSTSPVPLKLPLDLQEPILSSYHVGPSTQTHIVRTGDSAFTQEDTLSSLGCFILYQHPEKLHFLEKKKPTKPYDYLYV